MMLRKYGISTLRTGLGVALSLALLTTCATAQKKAAKPTPGTVNVPANIRQGSLVTTGRAFYPPKLPEDMLAGIRLGRQAKEVLNKWGNPSRITVGTVRSQGADQNVSPVIPNIPYAPPQGGAFGAGLTTGGIINPAAALLAIQNPALGLPGAQASPSPESDLEPKPAGAPTITSEEVTWTYDLQNGITIEFIITDGLVTQITVGGEGPWGLSKTRTGIQLGDTYKLVLWVCGYPENQKYAGRFLRASYVDKSRVLYTFLNKKLVGVTIAMVPSELM
ncbi:MAG: hypothetical protein GX139_10535 [Armatimonadetes bacterium]|nr:hypothetical protein [Armatimonadota bacterium]